MSRNARHNAQILKKIFVYFLSEFIASLRSRMIPRQPLSRSRRGSRSFFPSSIRQFLQRNLTQSNAPTGARGGKAVQLIRGVSIGADGERTCHLVRVPKIHESYLGLQNWRKIEEPFLPDKVVAIGTASGGTMIRASTPRRMSGRVTRATRTGVPVSASTTLPTAPGASTQV